MVDKSPPRVIISMNIIILLKKGQLKMFQKFSKKTLATIYISLFLVTLSLASVVIAFSAINANFGNQSEIYYTAADIKDGQTLN